MERAAAEQRRLNKQAKKQEQEQLKQKQDQLKQEQLKQQQEQEAEIKEAVENLRQNRRRRNGAEGKSFDSAAAGGEGRRGRKRASEKVIVLSDVSSQEDKDQVVPGKTISVFHFTFS